MAFTTQAQSTYDEKHIEASLRMIGHQVLVQAGDTSSLVLPIMNERGQYRIAFENEFSINPDVIQNVVNGIMSEAKIAEGYFLEVLQCESGEVAYSYEISDLFTSEESPCSSRELPEACYILAITLIGPGAAMPTATNEPGDGDEESGLLYFMAIVGLFILIAAVISYLWRWGGQPTDPNMIPLGKYLFDTRRSELILDQDKSELTGKEADLLLLLHDSANTTVERDVILNKVWGDEGDYVGRTLDVFISKLRKKLESDSDVQIVNIRGVGYKLVVS